MATHARRYGGLDRARFDELQARSPDGDLNSQADAALLRDLSTELLDMGTAVVALKLGAQGLYLRTSSDIGRLENMGRCRLGDPRASETEAPAIAAMRDELRGPPMARPHAMKAPR